jgi:L,D-transpeptidase ErfK/SrfK
VARHPLEAPPASADLVGRLAFHEARAEDTFVDLAPALSVGYVELLNANLSVDPWLPKAGTRLVLPRARLLPSGPREGIVINLGDLRLYFFEPGEPVRSAPIGIAKEGFATPLGETTVVAKKEKPTWIPGESARADGYPPKVPPGPDNPLGEPGTKVRVVNEPVKVGWVGNMLLLEVNPDSEGSLTLDQTGKRPASRIPLGLRDLVTRAAGKQAHRLDWGRIKRAALRQSGVPTAILRSERRPARASR